MTHTLKPQKRGVLPPVSPAVPKPAEVKARQTVHTLARSRVVADGAVALAGHGGASSLGQRVPVQPKPPVIQRPAPSRVLAAGGGAMNPKLLAAQAFAKKVDDARSAVDAARADRDEKAAELAAHVTQASPVLEPTEAQAMQTSFWKKNGEAAKATHAEAALEAALDVDLAKVHTAHEARAVAAGLAELSESPDRAAFVSKKLSQLAALGLKAPFDDGDSAAALAEAQLNVAGQRALSADESSGPQVLEALDTASAFLTQLQSLKDAPAGVEQGLTVLSKLRDGIARKDSSAIVQTLMSSELGELAQGGTKLGQAVDKLATSVGALAALSTITSPDASAQEKGQALAELLAAGEGAGEPILRGLQHLERLTGGGAAIADSVASKALRATGALASKVAGKLLPFVEAYQAAHAAGAALDNPTFKNVGTALSGALSTGSAVAFALGGAAATAAAPLAVGAGLVAIGVAAYENMRVQREGTELVAEQLAARPGMSAGRAQTLADLTMSAVEVETLRAASLSPAEALDVLAGAGRGADVSLVRIMDAAGLSEAAFLGRLRSGVPLDSSLLNEGLRGAEWRAKKDAGLDPSVTPTPAQLEKFRAAYATAARKIARAYGFSP